MRTIAPLILCLAAAAGTAADARLTKTEQSEEQQIAKALAGRTPGKPVACINSTTVSGPQIIGKTLLYNEVGRVWRTDLDACPGLREDSILVTELHGSQLCERDHFRVLDRGSTIPGATCLMGRFTPYSKPKP
jgi:hypothetical protein